VCGRYASTRSREDLLETFKIEEALADKEKAPDYNIAPTKTSPTVLARPPRAQTRTPTRSGSCGTSNRRFY
jgi:putative SOS response-associated peptidase YedK